MLTHMPRMRVCDHARATEQPWRRTGHGQGRAPSRACCCRSDGTVTRGPARSSARSHTAGSRGSAARQRGRPASPRAGFTRSVCARPMMPLKSRSSASTLPFRPIARSTKLHSSSGSTVKSAAGATLAPRLPSGLGVPSAGSCEGGGGRPGIAPELPRLSNGARPAQLPLAAAASEALSGRHSACNCPSIPKITVRCRDRGCSAGARAARAPHAARPSPSVRAAMGSSSRHGFSKWGRGA